MEVIVRRAEKSDIKSIREIYSQPHAYENTLQFPHPSYDMWEERFMNSPAEFHNLAAVYDGKVIGQQGLKASTYPVCKHVAEFGMGVSVAVLRKRAGSRLLAEAFKGLVGNI